MRSLFHSSKIILGLLIASTVFSCKTAKTGFDDKHVIVLDTMEITVPRDNPYRAAATKVFDLVHTKLEVKFDWEHQWMYGRENVTIKPHFYTQRMVEFDAKHMDIYKVELVKADGSHMPLAFAYDSLKLNITLDRTYKEDEKLTLFIDYKSKPNDHKSAGSDAIQDDKGLYFINPLGTDSDKPRQIWTQGETESNSNWFVTFDKPDFKSTEEIYMTVDKKYTTLSNGLLVSQKDNGDGTRTDYWNMDLPHAPYLFMMAVGEFVVTRDKWRDKEVSYYVEPKFAPYTKRIFGETPQMIEFFSQRLGYDYPWQKYSQVVVRDYVSGAMENTTATLHGENLNRTFRQAIDEDYHDYVSHELFHHWFGDLATCESWSNITLNESFADYSEYLWNEHRYGKEYADYIGHQAFEKYMNESRRGKNVNLVRFHYDDREAVFDSHSYEKGGRILHMLRYAVGDDAFFKSLQLYLKTYAFKATEVPELRLCFEQVTGRDMNWFFDQWYYNDGHPILDFSYSHTADSVYVKVTQKHNTDNPQTYELPFRIDIHYGTKIDSNNVVLKKKSQTFAFKAKGEPDLIDADAERILLCEKTENKSIGEYIFQYRHASNYMQKREAMDSLRKYQRSNYGAVAVYRDALRDPSQSVRAMAARYIYVNSMNKDTVLPMLKAALEADTISRVRAAIIETIGKQKENEYEQLVEKYLGDSSYLVASTSLTVLNNMDSAEALKKAKLFESDDIFEMKNAVYAVYALNGDSTYNGFFLKKLKQDKGYSLSYLMYYYANFLCRMNLDMTEKGIDTLKGILLKEDDVNKQFHSFGTGAISRIKDHYEREKAIYDGILGSDKKTKAKYNMLAVKTQDAKLAEIVNYAKAALAEVKKSN